MLKLKSRKLNLFICPSTCQHICPELKMCLFWLGATFHCEWFLFQALLFSSHSTDSYTLSLLFCSCYSWLWLQLLAPHASRLLSPMEAQAALTMTLPVTSLEVTTWPQPDLGSPFDPPRFLCYLGLWGPLTHTAHGHPAGHLLTAPGLADRAWLPRCTNTTPSP